MLLSGFRAMRLSSSGSSVSGQPWGWRSGKHLLTCQKVVLIVHSVTNSWVGYLSSFGQNLLWGGPQAVVFALLVATFVQGFITSGLAEMASAFPSTGVSRTQVSTCYESNSRRVNIIIRTWCHQNA